MLTNRISKALFVLFLIGWFLCANIDLVHSLMPTVGQYDSRRIVMLIMLALSVIYLLVNVEGREKVIALFQSFHKSIIWALSLFFLLGVISSLTAKNEPMAFLQVGNYFLLLMTMLIVATIRMDTGEKFDRLLLFSLMAIAAVLCIYSFIHYLQYWGTLYIIKTKYAAEAKILIPRVHTAMWNRITSPTFQNIRFFSQFLAWTLPLYAAVLVIKFKYSQWIKPLCFIVISYMWMLTLLNSSRAVFLGVIVAAIFAIILWRKNLKSYFIWQIATMVGAFVLYMVMIRYGLSDDSAAHHLADLASSGRWNLWWICLELMGKFPLLGTGPMQISYYSLGIGHPHNALLQTGAQWGIPAMLLVAYLVAASFLKLIGSIKKIAEKHPNSQVILLALAGGIIMAIVDSFFSGLIVMPLSQITGALFIGWALGAYWQQHRLKIEEKLALSVSYYHGFLIVFVLIATFAVAYGVFPTILHTTANTMLYINEVCKPLHMVPCMINPAFWAQGLIWVKPGLVLHAPHAAEAAQHIATSGAQVAHQIVSHSAAVLNHHAMS